MAELDLTEFGNNLNNSPYIRSLLAQLALEIAPPLIRNSLLEEIDFRDEYGLRLDAELSIGDSNITIQRSDLFGAVREIITGASEMVVTDTNGKAWKLKSIEGEGERPGLTLSRGKQEFFLPDYSILSPESSRRLHYFDEAASSVNLPSSTQEAWREILTIRALEDSEVDVFQSEFHDTPIEIPRSIREQILGGQSSISSLVPPSRKYFERLVGAYDGSASIRDYAAAGSGRNLFNQLSTWRPYDGFFVFALSVIAFLDDG